MTAFGKYQVVEQIGQGGFGRVYRGWDPVLKREVAIKVISLSAPQARERFVREAEIAANLRHPNIVTVFDYGEEDGQPYLVQEFLPGKDLEELIQSGEASDLRTRIHYLAQAADALHYAHSRGVVHRDVKPGNLRIQGDGSLRVMDFGIAKLLDAGADLTATGMSIGTSGYLAPEQLEGLPIDHRADIFSFGVVAYELFTGSKPFAGDTITTVLYRILHEEPAAIGVLAPGTPPRLIALVERCLRKQREERYNDLGEVVAELRAISAGLEQPSGPLGASTAIPQAAVTPTAVPPTAVPPAGVPPAGVPPAAPNAAERRGVSMGVAAVATLAVVIIASTLAYFWISRGRHERSPAMAAAPSVSADVSADPSPGTDALAGTSDRADSAMDDSTAAPRAAVVEEVPVATGRARPAPATEPGRVQASAPPAPPLPNPPVTAGGGAEPASTSRTDASTVAVDPDRVVILLRGANGEAVQLAEHTLVSDLTARGRRVVARDDLSDAQASTAVRRAVAGADARTISTIGRGAGAGGVFIGTLTVDAAENVAGLITGSAVLDGRLYDGATGALLSADRFQVGAGGTPGRAGTTALDAISQATESVARQAMRVILQRTGSNR